MQYQYNAHYVNNKSLVLYWPKCHYTHTHMQTSTRAQTHIKAPSPYVWEMERPSPWKQTSCSLVSHHPPLTPPPTPPSTIWTPPTSLLLPVYMLLCFSFSVSHSQHNPSSQNTLAVFLFQSPPPNFTKSVQFASIAVPFFSPFLHARTPHHHPQCMCLFVRVYFVWEFQWMI